MGLVNGLVLLIFVSLTGFFYSNSVLDEFRTREEPSVGPENPGNLDFRMRNVDGAISLLLSALWPRCTGNKCYE